MHHMVHLLVHFTNIFKTTLKKMANLNYTNIKFKSTIIDFTITYYYYYYKMRIKCFQKITKTLVFNKTMTNNYTQDYFQYRNV